MAKGLATKGLRHRAVAWLATTPDSRGIDRVEPPIEIRCRFTGGDRRTHNALSQRVELVADLEVDRELPIGTILWKGKLSELPSPHPTIMPDLMKVESFREVYDVKGRHSRKGVDVSAYSDTLPTVA